MYLTASDGSVASLITPSSHLGVFFFHDWVKGGQLPTASDGAPNPSSEIAYMPAKNLFQYSPQFAWRSKGLYRIDTATNGTARDLYQKGNKMRVTDTGGTTDIAITPGDYTDPLDFANAVASALTSNATLNGTYTCTYRDERMSNFTIGATSNFRFTLSCTETFAFDNAAGTNDICYHLGFQVAQSGASSYTSTYRACHSDEYVILDLYNPYNVHLVAGSAYGKRRVIDDINSSTLTSYRFVIIEGSNIPETGTGGMVYAKNSNIYLSSNTCFDLSSASWTLGVNKFFIAGSPTYGAYCDALMQYGVTAQHGSYFYLVDLCKQYQAYRTSNIGGFSQRYMKIRTANPDCPFGHVQMANVGVFAGWTPSINYDERWTVTYNDTSPSLYTDQGCNWTRKAKSYETVGLQWNNNTPMHAREVQELRHRVLSTRAPEQTYASGGIAVAVASSPLTRQSSFTVGKSKPFYYADPTQMQHFSYYATCGLTRGLGLYTMESFNAEQLPGVDRWSCTMSLREQI